MTGLAFAKSVTRKQRDSLCPHVATMLQTFAESESREIERADVDHYGPLCWACQKAEVAERDAEIRDATKLYLPVQSIDLGRGFDVVVADPPWNFDDNLPGPKRGARKHYGVLTDDEAMRYLKVIDLPVAPNAWLFLWRVGAKQQEALAVCEAWGFAPKTEIVWIKSLDGTKPQIGMGHYVRNAHECCIVATRGRPHRDSASVPSWFAAPRGKHSAKPERFFELVEQLVGREAQRVELFARVRRPDWAAMGAEL